MVTWSRRGTGARRQPALPAPSVTPLPPPGLPPAPLGICQTVSAKSIQGKSTESGTLT